MDSKGVKGMHCIAEITSPGDLFRNGSKRSMGFVKYHPEGEGLVLNLGCGDFNLPPDEKHFDLQEPDWVAPNLAFNSETVSAIHAYHFLEHLTGDEVKIMLQECARVLSPGGVMNICVPYSRADIAFQDIDHKTFFTEESWETLLANPYYDTQAALPFDIGMNFIAGVVGRNLSVFTQLVKRG